MREEFLFKDATIHGFGNFLLEYLDIQEVRVKADFFGGQLVALKEIYEFPELKLKPGKDENLFKMLLAAYGFDVGITPEGMTFYKKEYCFIEEELKRKTSQCQIFVLAPIEVDIVFICCDKIYVEYEL